MRKIIIILFAGLLIANIAWAGSATSEVLVKTNKSWDGTILPSYPQEEPEITVLRIQIPPKTKLSMHEHPVINIGYMTKGAITVTTETGEVLNLEEGDAIVEVVDKWHYGENLADTPAEIVVTYLGIKDSPITIKQ